MIEIIPIVLEGGRKLFRGSTELVDFINSKDPTYIVVKKYFNDDLVLHLQFSKSRAVYNQHVYSITINGLDVPQHLTKRVQIYLLEISKIKVVTDTKGESTLEITTFESDG